MKKILYLSVITILVAAGCSKEYEDKADRAVVSFVATVDGADTKTVLDGVNNYWNGTEVIRVLDGAVSKEFKAEGLVKASRAIFIESDPSVKLTGDDYLAVYPADAAVEAGWDGNTDEPVMMVRLADEQVAAAGSFDPSAHVAVGYSNAEAKSLVFRNVVSLIKFTVDNDDVKSVRFIGNNGEAVSGYFNVSYNGGEPIVDTADYEVHTSTELNGSILRGKTYYIAVLPGTFEKGISLEFVIGGLVYEKSTSKKVVLERNRILNLGTISFELRNTDTGYGEYIPLV